MTDTADAARVSARRENLVDAFASIARLLPAGLVREAGGAILVRTGLASPVMNVVFTLKPSPDPEKVEDSIREVFEEERLPWRLVATPETEGDLVPVRRTYRLDRPESLPGLVWTRLPTLTESLPAGFQVRSVRDL